MMILKEISKEFSSGFQLGPCSLTIENAETLGILGKNGSGKSTLFNLMTANLDLSAGEIEFIGQKLILEAYALKKEFGYLPQNLSFPPWVTGEELLLYAAGLYNLHAKDATDRMLQYWDCLYYRNLPLAVCSHGMQKRVGLAVATIHDPRLLLLDEPFSGLDVFHTKALEDLLIERKEQGKSNVISTHILPYVAQICDRVVVLKNGQLHILPRWAEMSYTERMDNLKKSVFN